MSRAFAPQAILTVVHGHSWLAAAKLAERLDVPLHLVLHDELTRHCLVHPAWKDRLQSRFARVWQQAASRLCVSPYMRESYEMRFGAKGEILYPGRSHDGPAYADPAPVAADRPFTVAYAGSLHALSSYRDLAEVARRLDAMNGRLLVCSWLREDWLRDSGLNRPNVTIARQPTSAHLVHFLRRQADVMLLSMSFDPVDRLNVELNFPSKLTDYTCTGLPIVAWGPAYSSGLRWASAHPGVAEVVVGADASDLLRVLQLLRSDPARRQALAKRAIEVGARMFSYDTVSSQFVSALSRPRV